MSYRLEWRSGPSAQIEILRQNKSFVLKYASPYRATIRPPVENLDATPHTLGQIRGHCEKLEGYLGVSTRYIRPKPPAAFDANAFNAQVQLAQEIGDQLLTLCLSNDVRIDLRTAPLFIELGLEEPLLYHNWELLFDGNNFLSLKHYLARFVNSNEPSTMRNRVALGGDFETLRILLISVPQPHPREGRTYPDPLNYAEAETNAIRQLLDSHQPDIDLVSFTGDKARKSDLERVLRTEKFNIVHFNGHAFFDPNEPTNSRLVLQDEDVDTGWVRGFVSRSAPSLCFVNACESAATAGERLSGLARAFLDTGAYLIGSPWRVGDQAASVFAARFYECFLLHEDPIGAAVMDARNECFKATGDKDLAWASYVYYGDPRVAFRKV
jgi:hypothetical protein